MYKLTPVTFIRGKAFPLKGDAEYHDVPLRETQRLMYFRWGIRDELAFRKSDMKPFGHDKAILQEVE